MRSIKVFGIGLNKTGTTTLGKCLRDLGYRHSSYDLALLEQVRSGDFRDLINVVESHEAFEDWPYPLVFDQLDVLYPGSRFILTRRRSPQVWLRSLEAHSLRTDPYEGTRTRTLAFGWPFPQLNPEAHIGFYEAHLARVRHYFRHRPQDLLEICWEEQPSWEPLCSFLGHPVPSHPLPHCNPSCRPNPERLRINNGLIEKGLDCAPDNDTSLQE